MTSSNRVVAVYGSISKGILAVHGYNSTVLRRLEVINGAEVALLTAYFLVELLPNNKCYLINFCK